MAKAQIRTSRFDAIRLLATLSVSAFAAEITIMFVLETYFQSSPVITAVIDASILTLVLFPVLYFVIFRKMVRTSGALASDKEVLRAARDELETTVQERTREIEKTKRELEESLQRFTDIAETAGDWIWEMDGNLRLSFMTPRFFEIFPIAREDLIGKTREEFAGVKEYDENWRRHFDDLANHRPFRNFSYSTAQSDGRPQHIEISGKPVFDADGVFRGYRGTGTNKTAEIEARAALEDSEKQFRDLIEGSIQGVFVHADWNILFVNQAMADIFGYESPEEILALKRAEPLIAPDERERLTGFRTARRKGEDAPEIYEVRGLEKNGSEIWLEFRVRNVDWHGTAAMQCVIVDISGRKAAEEALHAQREQLHQILANVPRAIITIDEKGIIKSFNPAAETTFGHSAEEAIDQNVSILMPKAEGKAHDGYIRSYMETGAKRFIGHGPRRLTGAHKDGREFPMELAIGEAGQELKSKLFIGIAKDITDDIKLENTLKQQNEQLLKRDIELNEQNDRFNAAMENMSHGLCMFDREQRLVVCNDRYASIYGLSPKLVKLGTTLTEILQHRIASGIYYGDTPEEYIRERGAAAMARQSSTKVHELSDGRSVVIRHHPLADGGWLDTHEDISDFRRIEKRLAHLAHHDSLTGLANRVLLRERLDEELKRSQRGNGFAVLCLDLDGFKAVNDIHGHAAGDELLKSVGERLQDCVRETDLVARLGGDEFAILQASVEQPADATLLAERIGAAISAPFNLGHDEVTIGGSIGIAFAPKDGSEPDQLLGNADLALYHVKGNGRGNYHLFEPALETSARDSHALGSDLRGALARNEFEVYYQPLFNLKQCKVSGFEALLRWHHGERGTIPPNEFIPVAEETGLISEIGEWVLKQACAEAARWPDGINVAVNVSPIQFRRGNLVQMVQDTLAATGLRANRLELEITESVLMQDSIEMLAKLHELKEIGVRISMDDFGTGYSSLSYLRSFPFDKIKIDASFVRGLSEGESDIGIVQAVVGLASRLGVETTAEGVETEEQLEIVRAEGCTEAQGYLFSPPRPVKDIAYLLPRRRNKTVSAA
ncbi:MAG: EAL domain-containing protein [Hoeflea sp.]|uniref:EAL domain-containing protein n=1 Tax=Hoeflea sp. TaxID=1940281 RepID=UPI001D9C73DC|nr:EAL domain-containing protein [Hoeflea sp.]MBU4529396.1 EAL domain-containing protein [Alphaproteobacteria bacterium]MBU4542303.1 EAL domain-containing protein [Alphaproteobacteria bacterium]MBU4548434.1 EAL domain-containing protein [Alphaproteobacteria bacterium]MBV1723314.1 EAL domain-containing protein [Hoeflea sp.]MBV1760003.1 EAL domain-containing protein [Hoeflea sp.]